MIAASNLLASREAGICKSSALRWNLVERDAGKCATSSDDPFLMDRRVRGILILWRQQTFLTLAGVDPIAFAISIDYLPSAAICRTSDWTRSFLRHGYLRKTDPCSGSCARTCYQNGQMGSVTVITFWTTIAQT
jgi:hypothetical protein